jgi:hypothetical protein
MWPGWFRPSKLPNAVQQSGQNGYALPEIRINVQPDGSWPE